MSEEKWLKTATGWSRKYRGKIEGNVTEMLVRKLLILR